MNYRNNLKTFLLSVLLFFFLYPSLFASENHEQEGKKKFDAGKFILGHISDQHDWHLWGHTSIPLPVILYSPEKGISIFFSNKFKHGHAAYNSYRLNEHGKIFSEDGSKFYDFSITKNVASLFISVIFLLLIFISVARSYDRRKEQAPKGLQSLLEPIIFFVRDDIVKTAIGEKKYEKYLPYLLTLFFFIWINNIMGLIPFFPGGANLTGNIAVPMTLAIFTFLITISIANKNYWRHVFAMPGIPIGVLPLITVIEIIGIFLKPLVLIIRLFANITAGHIIILSFISLIFIFAEMNMWLGASVSIVSVVFALFMNVLELLVGFLQAYVFTLLTSMYFGSAIEEAHQ
ncbi:MAG: F0F1 ATP synthase subunit A [Bacteroidota bacterium]